MLCHGQSILILANNNSDLLSRLVISFLTWKKSMCGICLWDDAVMIPGFLHQITFQENCSQCWILPSFPFTVLRAKIPFFSYQFPCFPLCSLFTRKHGNSLGSRRHISLTFHSSYIIGLWCWYAQHHLNFWSSMMKVCRIICLIVQVYVPLLNGSSNIKITFTDYHLTKKLLCVTTVGGNFLDKNSQNCVERAHNMI